MAVRSPSTLALASGIALDVGLLDPPNALHPVAWIGRAAARVESLAPAGARSRRVFGLVWAVALPLAVFEVVRRTQRLFGGHWLAAALLLSLSSSHRTLLARAAEVQAALEADDLDAARALLGRHLVSRETAQLSRSEVSAATIESVAENLSDGAVAPWLWFAVGGAPLAWAYRTSNTLDAMWGYRSARYEDLGKAAARIDDVWNVLPARLTAGAIAVAALGEPGGSGAFVRWRRDAGRTASPNAGHPMAAMAGALGVRLEKRSAYGLNQGGRAAEPADVGRALRIARIASALVAVVVVAASGARERSS